MSYGEEAAPGYEDHPEHKLPPEEAFAWLQEMARWTAGQRPSGRLLDVGAGTGLLTAVMKCAGYAVQGLEPSRAMIHQALARNPSMRREEFLNGKADDADRFKTEAFDWIISRQVLCHLTYPAKAFAACSRWLRPGGHIMLVDGFWGQSSWKAADLARQPFAAVRSADDVADMLSLAGFEILRAGMFDELNLARAAALPGTVGRYLVVARRKPSL